MCVPKGLSASAPGTGAQTSSLSPTSLPADPAHWLRPGGLPPSRKQFLNQAGLGVGRTPPSWQAGEGGEPMRHHLQAAQRDGAPDVTQQVSPPYGGSARLPPGPRDVPGPHLPLQQLCGPQQAGSPGRGPAPARGADGGGPHSIGRLVLTSPRAVRAAVIGCSLQGVNRDPSGALCASWPGRASTDGSLAPLRHLPGPVHNCRHTSTDEAAAPAGPHQPRALTSRRQGWMLCSPS